MRKRVPKNVRPQMVRPTSPNGTSPNGIGVNKDSGDRICHGKIAFDVCDNEVICEGTTIAPEKKVYLTNLDTKVLMAEGETPLVTENTFGKGKGIYLSQFRHGDINNRTLLNLILEACNLSDTKAYVTDNPYTECAYFPESGKLVVINNTESEQKTAINTEKGTRKVTLRAYETIVMDV